MSPGNPTVVRTPSSCGGIWSGGWRELWRLGPPLDLFAKFRVPLGMSRPVRIARRSSPTFLPAFSSQPCCPFGVTATVASGLRRGAEPRLSLCPSTRSRSSQPAAFRVRRRPGQSIVNAQNSRARTGGRRVTQTIRVSPRRTQGAIVSSGIRQTAENARKRCRTHAPCHMGTSTRARRRSLCRSRRSRLRAGEPRVHAVGLPKFAPSGAGSRQVLSFGDRSFARVSGDDLQASAAEWTAARCAQRVRARCMSLGATASRSSTGAQAVRPADWRPGPYGSAPPANKDYRDSSATFRGRSRSVYFGGGADSNSVIFAGPQQALPDF